MSDYDLNGNGVIDPEEKAMMLEDRRMRIEDDNAQRDQSRKMIWWVLAGMLGYPFFVIVSSYLGLDAASDILGSMATIYFPATSLIFPQLLGQRSREVGALQFPPPGLTVSPCPLFFFFTNLFFPF